MPPVLPSRRAGLPLEEVLARGLEHLADPTEAEEENPKVVPRALLVVGAGLAGACRLRVHRLVDNREGEEDVRADLARVGGRLEKAELDRVLVAVPEVVEVEGAVAGVVVMPVAALPVVVGVREARHRRVAELEHLVDELAVGAAGEPSEAVRRRSASLDDQLLLLVKNLHEVLDLLGGHLRRADVDVESRAAARPRARVAEGAHHRLEHRDVADAEDRADRLAPVVDRAVGLAVPLAPVGHRHHPVGKVAPVVAVGSADRRRDRLGRLARADPVVLELDPEGHLAQLCFRYRHLLFSFLVVRGGPSAALFFLPV